MLLQIVSELFVISNYHMSHMVSLSENCRDLILEQTRYAPPVCSGCGHVHNPRFKARGVIVIEDHQFTIRIRNYFSGQVFLKA